MNRRSFVQAVGGAGVLASAGTTGAAETSSKRIKLYRLSYYYMRQGDQGSRMHQFFSSQLPLLAKSISGPIGFFNVFVGQQIPGIVVLAGFHNSEEMEAATARYRGDAGFQKAMSELEHAAEQPYDRLDTVLLQAKDYSPEIEPLAEKPKISRIFELRVYHSPTQWQSRALDERMGGPEMKIFHRVGIHPILYAGTLIGANMPNLTYLTPFATLADREKAWDAFGADPEWVKVRNESVQRDGQVVSQINMSLLRPADYSPMQ